MSKGPELTNRLLSKGEIKAISVRLYDIRYSIEEIIVSCYRKRPVQNQLIILGLNSAQLYEGSCIN
jgi:hypothetical protein